MPRQPTSAVAYFDEQDPDYIGWAYRIYFDNGSEESGPLDTTDHENRLGATRDLLNLVQRKLGDHPLCGHLRIVSRDRVEWSEEEVF